MSKKDLDITPMELVTGRFKPLQILHHHDHFVVASGIWDDNDIGIACRWHVPGELGYPSAFGHPQWFHMPAKLEEKVTDYDGGSETLHISFTKRKSVVLKQMSHDAFMIACFKDALVRGNFIETDDSRDNNMFTMMVDLKSKHFQDFVYQGKIYAKDRLDNTLSIYEVAGAPWHIHFNLAHYASIIKSLFGPNELPEHLTVRLRRY